MLPINIDLPNGYRYYLSIRGRSDMEAAGNEQAASPYSFTMLPAYPNPFNAHTRVPIELSTSVAVQLQVYDLLGRQVIGSRTGYFSEGYHEMVFRGDGLPSWTYILQVRAGERQAVQPIVLVK